MKRLLAAAIAFFAFTAAAHAVDKANLVYMDLKNGRVTIELRPDLAPKHVERFKKLIKEGFYNGLKFHRVITGFMAQTGDPTGTGTGGSSYPDLQAEFTKTPFKRGTLGAARTGNPNSANSQFFICFEDAPHLNGQYTVFGQVIDGMQLVDQIKKGNGSGGEVFNPDTIVKMQLASDAKK
jgi:peptidylprolyl isomerase